MAGQIRRQRPPVGLGTGRRQSPLQRHEKFDLQLASIRWTLGRIHVHVAVCFMSYAFVQHLACQLSMQRLRMSPEAICGALKDRCSAVCRYQHTGQQHLPPSIPLRRKNHISLNGFASEHDARKIPLKRDMLIAGHARAAASETVFAKQG